MHAAVVFVNGDGTKCVLESIGGLGVQLFDLRQNLAAYMPSWYLTQLGPAS